MADKTARLSTSGSLFWVVPKPRTNSDDVVLIVQGYVALPQLLQHVALEASGAGNGTGLFLSHERRIHPDRVMVASTSAQIGFEAFVVL